jgi:t-SNARE complex subunit (syntaxin)
MAEMSNLEQTIRDLPREQRKELLMALQEKLRADRKRAVEEAKKQKVTELDEEYDEVQRKGREEV